MTTKREFLAWLLAVSLLSAGTAHADGDGGGGGGSGSSGSGGGGSGGGSDSDGGSDDGGGSGSSGSGSGSSGSGSSGSGDDDNDNDDNDDDDDDDEQTHARKAVARGDAVSLRRVLKDVSRQYPGRVVSVTLKGKGKKLQYSIKVIDTKNRLLNLVVNARTGQIARVN